MTLTFQDDAEMEFNHKEPRLDAKESLPSSQCRRWLTSAAAVPNDLLQKWPVPPGITIAHTTTVDTTLPLFSSPTGGGELQRQVARHSHLGPVECRKLCVTISLAQPNKYFCSVKSPERDEGLLPICSKGFLQRLLQPPLGPHGFRCQSSDSKVVAGT